MTTPRVQPVPLARPHVNAVPAPEGPFVINLCSSTTPVALSQPQDPELKRFSFFVSRRLEDGRERFRLHMGYFETLPEAEEWLTVVREVYPGAWAGETPGKRLRGKPAAPVTPGTHGAGPEPAKAGLAAPASAAVFAPAAARATPTAAARPLASKPQLRPQPPTIFPPASGPSPAAVSRAVGRPQAPPAAARSSPALPSAASTASMRGATLSPPGRAPRPAAATPVANKPAAQKPGIANGAAPAAARAPSAAAPKSPAASVKAPKSSNVAQLPFSNVREVLASLDETGSTQQMPAIDQMPTFKQVPARAGTAQSSEPGLSDSQVLRLLETRRPEGGRHADDSSIFVLKPDDTGTRRELREAVETNAPVSFAVQLQWSVQPIEIAKVPPLAIFSAYTLYTVEGSREGRRWYGLRLGFFTDAISAKQVAQYVRSEFASVAVVPVSAQERTRATATDKGKLKSSTPAAPVLDKLPETTEFKLIDEPHTPPVPAAPRAGAVAAAGAVKDKPAGPKTQTAAPQKRAAKGAGRVRAREKRSPQTLEETLEILGADQLEIDEGQGETLNDTGVRHLKLEVRKESPFTKLLDRLAERARKAR
jgi:hypothetical protein